MPQLTYTADHCTSKDGTRIGYRKLGTGPALILVHGGLMSSYSFTALASHLADSFTVYVPDRRGRGMSFTDAVPGLSYECEDIQAVIRKARAQYIFGLSSGAIIALQAALTEPQIRKIALFEPPLPVDGANPLKWAHKYEKAMASNNLGKAMAHIIKGTADGVSLLKLPGFILGPLLNAAIKADAQKKTAEGKNEAHLGQLIKAMRYDVQVVRDGNHLLEQAKNLKAETLLIGGEKSQQFLKTALDALNTALPHASRTELAGVGHVAADNNGKPELVANELKSFFL
jgi:pimeloyl-ACP methyl ester carboxylesterase